MNPLETLDRDGFAVLSEALDSSLAAEAEAAADRLYGEERRAGRTGPDGSLHLLGALSRDRALTELVDAAPVLAIVGKALGWNLYAYHSHLDIHPPVRHPGAGKWRWHQDGGRQNLELENAPTRPQLSLKVAWFLSDVSRPGRGNLMVLPGSHRADGLVRPSGGEDLKDPRGAQPVLAKRRSAVIFDRRLWHARSDNVSRLTRKVLFVAYTYRWVRPREQAPLNGTLGELTPLRRQLLGGAVNEDGHWLPSGEDAPLRQWLAERGLLDPTRPSHR